MLGTKIKQGRDNEERKGNQEGTKGGEETRGQRDTRKTLNEREMGSWDKGVGETNRRYSSSKEIKDHLHFGFSSAFIIIPL